MSIPDLGEAKDDLKITESRLRKWEYDMKRTCLSVNLPLCFTGATPPRPDPGHPPSVVRGVIGRFGYKPPAFDRKFLRGFRRFVRGWLRKNMTRLTEDQIPDFEQWLEETPYTQGRKDELSREWDKLSEACDFSKFDTVKSFIKDETYPTFKNPRIINSRVDAAKCFFGPAVAAVSDALFSRPEFIKTVPVPDRPVVIRDILLSSGLDQDYIFTDYTAFEAHFIKEIMYVTQGELFKYMLPDDYSVLGRNWFQIYMRTVSGKNRLIFKNFDATLEAVRMSGEMDTSLSNGFSNLMLFLYATREKGLELGVEPSVVGFVEGDDGLFRVSPASCAPTADDFARLGFTIKIGVTDTLSEASFCGQVYDMSDLIVVTDPIEVMLRVGWTNKRYTRANEYTRMYLLRAKGYSLVYQYNGCPLLSNLGRRILHLTEGVQIPERIFVNMDQWEAAKLRAAITADLPSQVEPGIATRNLVDKLYGISLEKQRELEDWIDGLELGFHRNPFDVPPSWIEYFDRYSLDHLVEDPCWMLRDEGGLLKLLARYKCCTRFLKSL